jgi:hypothetical protein
MAAACSDYIIVVCPAEIRDPEKVSGSKTYIRMRYDLDQHQHGHVCDSALAVSFSMLRMLAADSSSVGSAPRVDTLNGADPF